MKKSLSILLVTVATLSLAACSNTSKETATAPATTEASQKTTTETSYPVTSKHTMPKETKSSKSLKRLLKRSSPTTFQQLKFYLNLV